VFKSQAVCPTFLVAEYGNKGHIDAGGRQLVVINGHKPYQITEMAVGAKFPPSLTLHIIGILLHQYVAQEAFLPESRLGVDMERL
jgi:hypothetical protein